MILLEDVQSVQETILITQRILSELNQPLKLGDREVFVTTSIGIVLGKPLAYAKAADLLRDADIAMYRAKANGKEPI